MTNMQSLINQYETKIENFRIELRESFKQFVRDFFKEVPELKTIFWTQYTPYFNDGDTCEFRVNEPLFANFQSEIDLRAYDSGNEELAEGQWLYDGYGVYGARSNADHIKQKMDEFTSVIQSTAMRDVLQMMFGDHVQVTITESRMVSSECEHD